MLKKTLSLASAVMLSISLVACGGSGGSSEAPAEETQAEATAQSDAAKTDAAKTDDAKQDAAKADATATAAEPVAATLIGEASPDALRVKVTNNLDGDVTGIAMRRTGDAEWGENLLKENEVVKKGASVELGIAADDTASYDLQLTDAKGTKSELTSLALTTMSELTLHIENGKAYATYVDLDGVEGTTKQETETQVTDGATSSELIAPQDDQYYEEPAYVEEQTYEEPAYEAPVYEEPVYEEPVYEEPVQEAAPEQSADDCTRDNIILD